MRIYKRLLNHSFFSILVNFFNLGIFQASSMLLQFLAIPIITRKYGIEVFGQIVLSTSFAVFIAGITNYGTHQTAIKEVAINKNNPNFLSVLFFRILYFRTIASTSIIPGIVFMCWLHPVGSIFLWLSILPVVLAEIFNPLYFLIGYEKIGWISWGNSIAKLVSLLLLVFVPITANFTPIINLMMGMPVLIYYIILCVFIFQKQQLIYSKPTFNALLQLGKENFYIMFNGVAVSLQQSIFLFVIVSFVSAQTLGAYAIIDKLLSACRQLVSSFSSAVYPKAAQLYDNAPLLWTNFKNKIQKGYALFFGIAGLFIIVFAPQIVWILTGNSQLQNAGNQTILFVRFFAFAPMLLALNANNVLSLLLQKKYKSLFYISILILAVTAGLSFVLVKVFSPGALGWYPLLIETACLFIYSIFIRKKTK